MMRLRTTTEASATFGALVLGYWLISTAVYSISQEPESDSCPIGLFKEVIDPQPVEDRSSHPREPSESPTIEIIEVLDIAQSAYAEPQKLARAVAESAAEPSDDIAPSGFRESLVEALPFPEETRVGRSVSRMLRDRFAPGYVRWISSVLALPGSTVESDLSLRSPPESMLKR